MLKKILDYFSWFKKVNSSQGQGFGGYEMEVIPGERNVLYVAFSGIGDLKNTTVPFEWKQSLSRTGEGAHIILVKDNLRQWYTNPDGQKLVATAITEYIKDNQIEDVLALGMSMGGYGAIVFSSLIEFNSVVALSSRECVGKASTFDQRNRALMKNIVNGPQSHIENLINPRTRYCFISSADQVEDLMHFMRLTKSCPQAHYFLARGNHNLGHEMIVRGTMLPFLKWLLGSCLDKPPKGINPAKHNVLRIADHLQKTKEKNIDFATWKKKYADIPSNEIPLFLLHNSVQLAVENSEKLIAYPLPTHTFVSAEWVDPYLAFGWYLPDKKGVWSKGHWHILNGQLTDHEGCEYQLRIQLEAFFPKQYGDVIPISFFQAGQLTKTINVERKKKTIFVSLPLLPDENYVINVSIHTPHADFPSRSHNNSDYREVGVYLKGFVVLHDE
ncbi:hypothetical protein [Vreelandella sedimenti]|uniref:hypothetical protein n=1 Tax=Vreelandella sedimenti TaxID=2729618 RepID=UPI00257D1164|nr:hypothetical protein [Halomonas sp. UBA3173]|tara:strand:- start:13381 stop:14709 length:1329 start_codon:yes stop_codon:yes gene_type:complete